MATMNLNDWLQSYISSGSGFNFQPGYEWMDPYAGRTVESLTPAEKHSLILQSSFANNDPAKAQEILNRGSFEYTPGRSGSILEDFQPLLTIAGIAAGAGGLGGLFGAEGAVSGGLEGALGGEALGSAGFGGAAAPAATPSLTDWFSPGTEGINAGDQLARAPTSRAPRFTGNIWDNVNIAGNYAPVETLPYTANTSELSGLPGRGGVPYDPASSPIPLGEGTPSGYQGYNPNQYLSGTPSGGTGPIGDGPDMSNFTGEVTRPGGPTFEQWMQSQGLDTTPMTQPQLDQYTNRWASETGGDIQRMRMEALMDQFPSEDVFDWAGPSEDVFDWPNPNDISYPGTPGEQFPDTPGVDPNIFQEAAKKIGQTAAQSVFSDILKNGPTADNMGRLIGAVGPGLAQEFFASRRADNLSSSLTRIADQARGDRAPFLDYARSTLAGGPEAYAATGPGATSLKGVLARLSARFGNPIGAPTALGIATDSANRMWGNDWRQAANIGLGGNYSNLAGSAAVAGAGTTGAGFGDAAASLFGEKTSLEKLLAQLKQYGINASPSLA